nr:DNA polymerase epsilon subunit 2 [Polyrhizophydium stewartii]
MPGGAADGRQRALGLTIFKIMEKKHGLRLSTEATAYLAEAFADVARQDMLESIDFLAQHYVQQHGTLNTLDGMGMDDIGADAIGLGTGAAQELGHYLQVVDAFDVPQFRFHADRSAFLRTAFGNNVDFFGGARFTDETAVLQRVESGAEDVSIVILSDVWLDQTRVLDKLRVLFDGMTQTTARLAFVLCGNFSSAPYIYGGAESKRYKGQ